jgi:hypothetical protein
MDDRVDSNWSGAIPFTLIINNKKQKRFALEKETTFEELNKLVKLCITK